MRAKQTVIQSTRGSNVFGDRSDAVQEKGSGNQVLHRGPAMRGICRIGAGRQNTCSDALWMRKAKLLNTFFDCFWIINARNEQHRILWHRRETVKNSLLYYCAGCVSLFLRQGFKFVSQTSNKSVVMVACRPDWPRPQDIFKMTRGPRIVKQKFVGSFGLNRGRRQSR